MHDGAGCIAATMFSASYLCSNSVGSTGSAYYSMCDTVACLSALRGLLRVWTVAHVNTNDGARAFHAAPGMNSSSGACPAALRRP